MYIPEIKTGIQTYSYTALFITALPSTAERRTLPSYLLTEEGITQETGNTLGSQIPVRDEVLIHVNPEGPLEHTM